MVKFQSLGSDSRHMRSSSSRPFLHRRQKLDVWNSWATLPFGPCDRFVSVADQSPFDCDLGQVFGARCDDFGASHKPGLVTPAWPVYYRLGASKHKATNSDKLLHDFELATAPLQTCHVARSCLVCRRRHLHLAFGEVHEPPLDGDSDPCQRTRTSVAARALALWYSSEQPFSAVGPAVWPGSPSS